MKKSVLVILVLWIAAIFIFVPAYSQEDMEKLNNQAFTDPQRPPAVFRHDEHNETAEIDECNVCHHVYEDGKLLEDESSEDQSCSDCHTLEAENGQPSLEKAFHLNCKGCHLKQKKGPITCGECHVKD